MPTAITDSKQIDAFLTRSVQSIMPNDGEHADAFKKKLLSGERIRVYTGIDPTGPSLHIGHLIWLKKLAELQALGHEVIMLIGDFTAMIGDPTDKKATRKRLTREEVLANCAVYKEQASKLLKFDGENPAQMKFNSEWLAKMSFGDVVDLASHFTVQQMMERDMFEVRAEEMKPIYLHEFMYPLMQGYDSVVLDVDLEIGGNDQMFNMLAGRTLQREMKGKEKFVITLKLLEDATGKKMGKSEGNIVAFSDEPNDVYGKVMSWTDGMILPGYELITNISSSEILEITEKLKTENPMVFKRRLAKLLVEILHDAQKAEEADAHFTSVHQEKERPSLDEMIPVTHAVGMTIVDALVASGFVSSKSDARRQIEQAGVKLNDEAVTSVETLVNLGDVIQKGKRFFARID